MRSGYSAIGPPKRDVLAHATIWQIVRVGRHALTKPTTSQWLGLLLPAPQPGLQNGGTRRRRQHRCWRRETIPQGPSGPFFLHLCRRIGQRKRQSLGRWLSRAFIHPQRVVQWPRERLKRERRPAGADLRVSGRFGSRKNVPSGNSMYRLNTCIWPSPPRRPSITNLVPTGNRVGRRVE